ncbi:MAG: hypothetical protein HYY17_09175 [Planctomycetes bacterium]|nr:hypothetical protein [Planctomycetota bacterium]
MLGFLLGALAQVHVAGKDMDVFGERGPAEKAARETDAAGARFREIFGAAPRRGAVILTREGRPVPDRDKDRAYFAHGAKWIWRWEAGRGAEPDTTMAHELGHLWLLFWADGPEPKTRQYGSTLPDWIDEGFASLMEGETARRLYSGAAKRLVRDGTRLPLADLLGCIHPDSREKTDRPKAKDRLVFYTQSWSVVAFLEDRYGAAALRHLLEKIRSGKRVEDALGEKGLPKTLGDLDAEWEAWAAR